MTSLPIILGTLPKTRLLKWLRNVSHRYSTAVCPACGQINVRQWRSIRGHLVLRCVDCSCRWSPATQDVAEFYRAGHNPHLGQPSQSMLVEVDRTLQAIEDHIPEVETLLDIGCGFGHLIKEAVGLGYDVVGIEPDEERAHQARKSGATVIGAPFSAEIVDGRKFDAVVLSHVIEHLTNPFSFLCEIASVLRPNGLLFIATPNFGGLRARIMRHHFPHYCPPEHMVFFNRQSLNALLFRAGFQPMDFRPFSTSQEGKSLVAFVVKLRWVRTSPEKPANPVAPTSGKVGTAIGTAIIPLMNFTGGDSIHLLAEPVSKGLDAGTLQR